MRVKAHRTATTLFALSVVAVVVGCASESDEVVHDSSSVPSAAVAGPIDGVTGELIITRQRDLLDRGLINVLTRNNSAASLLLDDIRLVSDSFVAEPAADRTISLRNGRQVAIQVPYGTVDDCDIHRPVTAQLTFEYTNDHDAEQRLGTIDLDGTDILETIRADACARRHLDGLARIGFTRAEIVGNDLVTELRIEPIGSPIDVRVSAVSGTVLVGVHPHDGWVGTSVDGGVSIPLRFVVNRCDPHALGEVTKRFGLDLQVSIDGDDPASVEVDVEPLVTDLEAIVELCRVNSLDE